VGQEEEERFAAGYVGRGIEKVLEGGNGCAADVEGVSCGGGGGRSERGDGEMGGGGGERSDGQVPVRCIVELVDEVRLAIGSAAGNPAVGEGLWGGGVRHWRENNAFQQFSSEC
jgi:hypothetical protein